MSAEELVTMPLTQTRRNILAALDGLQAAVGEHPAGVDITREAGNDDVGHEDHIPGTRSGDYENREQQGTENHTIEDCYRLPELDDVVLANIELSNAQEVSFFELPDEYQARLVEIIDAGLENELLDDELRPMTAFQCFSPHPGNLFLD